MLLRPSVRPLCLSLSFHSKARRSYRPKCLSKDMGRVELDSKAKRQADFRLCNVSSHMTELLEIRADDPKMHVLLIPGNPGVVPFYKDFVESLYEFLDGNASITAISHLSHTKKDWDHGRLFSLEEQTDHKPHVFGRWISSSRSLKILKFLLYWLDTLLVLTYLLICSGDPQRRSRVVSAALSLMVAALGFLPRSALRLIVTNSLAKSWSAVAVEATCSHLVQYHTMRNVLFMAMTEFRKLTATPDWAFMREKKEKLAFLFGGDDHWGPLQMFEEISKQVPGIALSIERGHNHAFSCTEAGASCVAKYVASLIKNQLLHSRQ